MRDFVYNVPKFCGSKIDKSAGCLKWDNSNDFKISKLRLSGAGELGKSYILFLTEKSRRDLLIFECTYCITLPIPLDTVSIKK